MDGYDVLGGCRVDFELLPEPRHVRVDGALVAVVVVALDAVDELEAREHAARRAGEREQQLELRRRQLDRLTLDNLSDLPSGCAPAGSKRR